MINTRKIIALQPLLYCGERRIIGGAKDLTLKMYFDICESNFSHFRKVLDYKNKKKLGAPLQDFSHVALWQRGGCAAICTLPLLVTSTDNRGRNIKEI
jgi:hypothetical protein